VLTGFLGAGKTTLLNRLLAHPDLADAAVVINEFGEIGIDHLLVQRTGPGAVLLSSGCLCCTIRGELVETLADLAQRRDAGALPAFRRLIVETTGLADPAPILQTIVAHPDLASTYDLDAVVTLVDALHGEATLIAHEESVRQVAVADRLALSKTDLLGETAPLENLAWRLRALNPAASLLDARTAPAEAVLAPAVFDLATKTVDVRRWLAAEAYEVRHVHHRHAHEVNRHDAEIRAFVLTTEQPIPRGRLESFLDLVRRHHGPGLLRLKAVVKLAEDPRRPVVLHGVQHLLHPVTRLDRWPDGDERSRLVFVMRGVEPAAIEGLFAVFLGEPRIDQPDAAALTDNPLALR
jgi:G3E family GTPase